MGGLEQEFGDRVDFVHVDWDDPDSQPLIDRLGAPRRSTYILLGPDGEVIWTYVGLLDEESAAEQIESALR